jgi:hypothetical protein
VTPAPGACWRIATGALHWRQWDGEFVVFHEATAATHLLDAAHGEVLLTLYRSGRELGAMEVWHSTFGGDSSARELALLMESLASLTRAGLVTLYPS